MRDDDKLAEIRERHEAVHGLSPFPDTWPLLKETHADRGMLLRMLDEAAAREARLRAKIQRLENECYKKCGVCEFDYGRAAPKEADS
jgi:hypothetical protein